MRKNISSLSAGIISDLADDRAALEQVQRGCRVMDNMELGRYGHADKRAGTDYIGALKAGADWRLEEFEFSAFTKYVIEFGDQYARFWSNDAQVEVTPTTWVTSTSYSLGDAVTNSGATYYCIEAHTSGTFATDLAAEKWYALEGNILEVPTPYTEAQIHEFQTQQAQDFVFIAHPDVTTRVLKRYSDTNWQMEASGVIGPYEDGDSDITMNASAATGSITLNASADYFVSSLVGVKFRLLYEQSATTKSGAITDVYSRVTTTLTLSSGTATAGDELREVVGSEEYFYTCIADYDGPGGDYVSGDDSMADYPGFFSAGCPMISSTYLAGRWDFATQGNWKGTFHIQTSPDDSIWTTVNTMTTAVSGENFTTGQTEDTPAYVRVLLVHSDTNYIAVHTLTIGQADIPGTVSVTVFTDAQNVTATVDDMLYTSGDAKSWQIEAWNPVDGYPRAIGQEDNRLIYGGTAEHPLSKWYGEQDDYVAPNFVAGTLATSPFKIRALGLDSSPIQWLSNHDGPFLGTASAEATARGRTPEQAISPENLPSVVWFSNQGNAYLPPVVLNSRLFSLQAGGETLNEFSYSIERGFNGGYDPEEATLLAENVLEGGVRQMTIRREPEKGVWLVKNNGDIAVFTHRPKARMAGWWKITTEGSVKSIAILRGDGNEDEVYWAVVRNGVGYLEKMRRGNMQKRRDAETATTQADVLSNIADLNYLDSATKFTGSAMTNVTGLTRFASQAVTYLRDGVARTGTVDSSGEMELDEAADVVLVGLPYTAVLEPRSIEYFSEFGTSMSRNKQVVEILASYYLSIGGEVRDTTGAWRSINYQPKAADNPDGGQLLSLRTELRPVPCKGYANRKKSVAWRSSDPYPFTLRGLYVELQEHAL